MRKAVVVVVVIAMMLMAVAGCTATVESEQETSTKPEQAVQDEPEPAADAQEQPSEPAEPEHEAVTLKLFHGKQEAQETFSEIIEAFNKEYPYITIEQEIVTNEPAAILKAKIATDEIPDIFSAGVEVVDIAKAGYMVDLTDELFLKDINAETLGSSSFTDKDGRTWALPMDGSCIGVYYNKAIFEENGLTPPKTISEMENVLAVLKDKNVTAFALGFKDAWTIKMASISAFSPAVYGNNQNWDEEKNTGKASFADTQGWATTFEMLKLIYDNGNTSTAFDTDYNAACAMFANGEAAMMAQGLWALDPIRDISADLDIGIMGFPVSEDPADAKLHQFPDFSLSISNQSEHIEEAKLFLAFLTKKEIAEMWSNNAKLFSAVNGVAPNFDPVVDDVNALIAEGRICPQGDRGWPTPFHQEFETSLPNYLLGNADLAQTLETLDTAWENSLAVTAE